ncbi:MAG TPA: lytic murein transglycosylase [Geminicoccaceae bacterium]|nr:lytic murein transglycosylase [Geminicoccaceae bacterium]
MLELRRRTSLGVIGSLFWLAGNPRASAAEAFPTWLAGLRREARGRGIRDRTLDEVLAGVRPIPAVIEADRRQPEGRMTFAEYRRRVVSDTRIEKGRERLAVHRDLLARVEARHGVPAEVMVALWGIESNFGERQGNYPVFAALATLAHDGRRAAFFRRELLNALEIVDRGHIDAGRMLGSWAGAMGQNQFMPSSYLHYAVDFDGDGRRDIWGSLPDVFASMANYLASSGWDARYIWGREVIVPRRVEPARVGLDHRAPLAAWQDLGVRTPDGGTLPDAPIRASLVRMDDGAGPSYLVYGNFRALMAWNRSTYFGVSVGLLSDSLKDG